MKKISIAKARARLEEARYVCIPPAGPWEPLVRARDQDEVDEAMGGPAEVWTSPAYTVLVRRDIVASPIEGWPKVTWLSIRRDDRGPLSRDWRDLQRIKNQLVDPESDAVEIYPAESRLVDQANQFHLWVFPKETPFPIGWFGQREVAETPGGGAVNRGFGGDAPPEVLLERAKRNEE